MLTGGPSLSACQPIWGDLAWTILGLGVRDNSHPTCFPRPGCQFFLFFVFCLSSCFNFSSHHHKIRLFTFQVKEQSRQRTKPISYYVQIWLPLGCFIFFFQCRDNDVTKGNTSQRGAVNCIEAEFSMHSAHCCEHECVRLYIANVLSSHSSEGGVCC